jgi:probable phosphoglycerate mutase
MAIYLVRHGETADNAARIVQLPDATLSVRGREEASRLAVRIVGAQGSARVARVRSSDYARALETAAPIVEATGAPLVLDASLRERNYGDIRGTAYAALTVDIMAPDYEPPGGETWREFDERVDRAWAGVVAEARELDGDLVVVTHGLVCRGIAARHLVVRPEALASLAWGNTALTIVEPEPPGTVRVLACTAHLDGSDGGAPV